MEEKNLVPKSESPIAKIIRFIKFIFSPMTIYDNDYEYEEEETVEEVKEEVKEDTSSEEVATEENQESEVAEEVTEEPVAEKVQKDATDEEYESLNKDVKDNIDMEDIRVAEIVTKYIKGDIQEKDIDNKDIESVIEVLDEKTEKLKAENDEKMEIIEEYKETHAQN